MLKGAKKRLMIYGRKQKEADTDEIWGLYRLFVSRGKYQSRSEFSIQS
ncbi:MAG: hypothetical protein ACLSEV_07850 [Coprococcus sp.]